MKLLDKLIPMLVTSQKGMLLDLNTGHSSHSLVKVKTYNITNGLLTVDFADNYSVKIRTINNIVGSRYVQMLSDCSILELNYILNKVDELEEIPVFILDEKIDLTDSQVSLLKDLAEKALVILNNDCGELVSDEFFFDHEGVRRHHSNIDELVVDYHTFEDVVKHTIDILSGDKVINVPTEQKSLSDTVKEVATNLDVEVVDVPMAQTILEETLGRVEQQVTQEEKDILLGNAQEIQEVVESTQEVQEPVVQEISQEVQEPQEVIEPTQEPVVEEVVQEVVQPVVEQVIQEIQEPVIQEVVQEVAQSVAQEPIIASPTEEPTEESVPLVFEEATQVTEQEPSLGYEIVEASQEVQIPAFNGNLEEEEQAEEVQEQPVAPQPIKEPTAEDGMTLSEILSNTDRFSAQVNPACEDYMFYYDSIQQIFYQYHEPTQDLRING